MTGDDPTPFDKARDRLIQAMAACDRQHLRDAMQHVDEAHNILETEEAFREARRGRT